jgi:molybdopterin molybdotransferase
MSCCEHAGLTPLHEALALILEKISEVTTDVESIFLDDALGRVLSEDVISKIPVPPTDNSAVDGYVVSRELCGKADASLQQVVARIPAGVVPSALPASAVARIFTGATVPEGGVAVVMQEDCQQKGDRVVIPANINTNQNIRPAAQDIAVGSVVLHKGRVLKPQDIGLAASVGLAKLVVRRKLKVAVFSTGDELMEPDNSHPAAGKIYNSNRYTLVALLNKLFIDVVDIGIIPDQYEATVAALSRASEADLIISSGGVSVGEEDHVKAALEETGHLDLWKLAIKPGKPLAFGMVGKTPFLGLPGNPSAVFVTFCLVAIKVIERLRGQLPQKIPPVRLPAWFTVSKKGNRQEYLRVRLSESQGMAGLEMYPNQSSGVLSSVSWADGFAVLPAGQAINKGDPVEYISFASLGI